MDWFRKLLREAPSTLLGVIVGWWLSGQSAKQITDLEHRPAFVAESLTFVVDFTAFYDQQSRDFKTLAGLNGFYALSDPQQKAFIDETLTKLSNAEKQMDLLEFKATRYFHGTDWLAKFEEIHQIWSSAAATTSHWFNHQLSGYPLPSYYLSGQLSKESDQLSQKTAELLERFVSLLKNLPAESTVFQHVPTPTPTPAPDFNSVN
jgi:hypothetical protein